MLNFKLIWENFYLKRKLVTNIFARFSSKNVRKGMPSRASTEFKAKQTKLMLPQLATT